MPGHLGVNENERADDLVKKGPNSHFVGLMSFSGTPKNCITSIVRQWAEKDIARISLNIGKRSG